MNVRAEAKRDSRFSMPEVNSARADLYSGEFIEEKRLSKFQRGAGFREFVLLIRIF